MIAITDKSRSAVRALAELSRRAVAAPVPIVEISEAVDVPPHVLEQLFTSLRRAGILQSQRGVKGGYAFRRPPAEVTVLEVVEAVDGPLEAPAPQGGSDATGAIFVEARRRVAEVLSGVSVADVAEREARLRDAPMFHI